MARFQRGAGAMDAKDVDGSATSSAESESDEELHVVDPSDPRAHQRRAPAAKPTREARSRWDSDPSEVDEDLGERVVITIDDSDDEDASEESKQQQQQQQEKSRQETKDAAAPVVKLSSWARARFFAAPGERKAPEVVEDPPLEPLNDFILSDFGSRFRGATGDVVVEKAIAVDLTGGSDDEAAGADPRVGAPLFSSAGARQPEARDAGGKDAQAKADKPARPARKRPESRYFVTDLATKCFNCGQVGHMSSQCVNDKVYKPCYYCALRGHSSFECPHLPCSSCLQLGHEVWDCSNRRLTLQSCEVCGRVGHADERCPNASARLLKDVTCMVCMAPGHLHCVPVPAPADRRVYCPHCAGNHALRQCREYVEPDPTPFSRAATRMATKCFRCQEYGHMAAECTADRGGYNAGACFNCGRRGHFASDCAGGGSRLSGRKRGRDEDEDERVAMYADEDDADDGYYRVPGARSSNGGYARRGNGGAGAGYAELDKPLPTYRQPSKGKRYSSGEQGSRRRR